MGNAAGSSFPSFSKVFLRTFVEFNGVASSDLLSTGVVLPLLGLSMVFSKVDGVFRGCSLVVVVEVLSVAAAVFSPTCKQSHQYDFETADWQNTAAVP